MTAKEMQTEPTPAKQLPSNLTPAKRKLEGDIDRTAKRRFPRQRIPFGSLSFYNEVKKIMDTKAIVDRLS
jgi:hypothetical protein